MCVVWPRVGEEEKATTDLWRQSTTDAGVGGRSSVCPTSSGEWVAVKEVLREKSVVRVA